MGDFWDHFGIKRRRAESWQERRDVPTSRRRVNEKRKSTSDQRRRDISAIPASTSLKAKGLEIEGGSENV